MTALGKQKRCATILLRYNGVVTRMKLKIGSPVSGSNFFPRPDVTLRLHKALERDHVSFLAPRRTGKTSVLIHLEESASPDHPHFRINLETCTTPSEMMAALMSSLAEEKPRWAQVLGKVKDSALSALNNIDSVSIAGNKVTFAKGADWKKPAEIFLNQLVSHKGPVTFLLDEFPILVEAVAKQDRDDCESMLRWFREWRQRTTDSQIRFLVTGSIGLGNVVRRHGFADTVNDFDTIDLPPLVGDEPLELIAALADGEGIPLTREHGRQIIELTGNAYPYFLQIFVAEIGDFLMSKQGLLVTPELLEKIYRDRIVAGPKNQYLPHMWDRLEIVLSSNEVRIAKAILRGLAQQQDGLSGEQIAEAGRVSSPDSSPIESSTLHYVLEVLKHDGYILQDFNHPYRTRFFSNLLRDYWTRHHV
jgi:hypothetical protein